MKILQIGAPKSGNFWLWKILQNIKSEAGLPNKSHVQEHDIYPMARTWDLSYDRQADIDMLDIEERGCFWRISSVFRMPIDDISVYADKTDHAWTHSRYCERTPQVLDEFDRIVYVVRDPRDRLLSAARFAFTPYMQKYYPHGEESRETFIQNRFDEHMEGWRWHVYDYLRYSSDLDIHFVFYERLLHDFDDEFARLAEYLGVDLSERARKNIKRNVTFETMRGESPGHVKKGKCGKWCDRFDERQKGRAVVLTGPLLDMLGYPRYERPGKDRLPSMPDDLTASHVERIAKAV